MADIFTTEKRSEIMKKIKPSNNKTTELQLIAVFNDLGIKGWRRHYKVKGHPDFIFQKQKIAIVRALIKEPKILILDEATSAFDSESEFKFKLEMKKLKGKMTTIMISHRLSLIKDCDQIIVIDKGKIEEQGNHEQLIRLKGIYYNLMENQINE